MLRSAFKVRVHGRENLPVANYVAICNHLQWLDPLLATDALPARPRVHAMGDPSDAMRKSKSLWWLLCRIGGIIPIDRAKHADATLFDAVQRCLERGGSVLIFPEGRCGRAENTLQPFKKGFAHFGLRAGVPVVPMAITGSHNLWFRTRIDVAIGKPIETAGMQVDELVAVGRRSVAAAIRPYRRRRGPRLLHARLTRMF